MKYSPNKFYISFGTNNHKDGSPRYVTKVLEIHTDPEYKHWEVDHYESVKNGIALLKLDTQSYYGGGESEWAEGLRSDAVRKIGGVVKILSKDYSNDINVPVIGTGFGQTVNSEPPDSKLPESVMRLLSNQEVASSFDINLFHLSVFENIIKAFPTHICHGDSGEPLLVWNQRTERFEFIGISSIMPVSQTNIELAFNPCHEETVLSECSNVWLLQTFIMSIIGGLPLTDPAVKIYRWRVYR